MLLMPGVEDLLMKAISCKVISCSTHKAAAFLSLVVVHCLNHSKAQPLDDIWLKCLRVWQFRVRQEKFSSPSIATHPVGAWYLLYLSQKASEDPNPLLCGCEGCCASIFLASVYSVLKLVPACSLSGNSAITNPRASCRLGVSPW